MWRNLKPEKKLQREYEDIEAMKNYEETMETPIARKNVKENDYGDT